MFDFCIPILAARHTFRALAFATSTLHAVASYAERDVVPVTPPVAVPLKFDSVLSGYKPMTDQKLGSWREANDTVSRIGGWRTYLREAQSKDSATPSATQPAAVANDAAPPKAEPKPNPHAGHGARP